MDKRDVPNQPRSMATPRCGSRPRRPEKKPTHGIEGPPGPAPVNQPRSAIHQVAPRPAWVPDAKYTTDKRDIPEPDAPYANHKFDPVLALEQWHQHETEVNGLVDFKVTFVPGPDGRMPNLKQAAEQVLEVLTGPFEDRTGQVH